MSSLAVYHARNMLDAASYILNMGDHGLEEFEIIHIQDTDTLEGARLKVFTHLPHTNPMQEGVTFNVYGVSVGPAHAGYVLIAVNAQDEYLGHWAINDI